MLGQMAVENMLLDPVWGRSWEAMRRGTWRDRAPVAALAEYDGTGRCGISFQFG